MRRVGEGVAGRFEASVALLSTQELPFGIPALSLSLSLSALPVPCVASVSHCLVMRGISPEKHGDFSVAIARNARSAIMTLFDAALSRLRSHTCEYAYANDENCDKKPS